MVLPQSLLENFNFINSSVSAGILGTMEFTKGWKFNNTTLEVSSKPQEKKAGGIEETERLKQ